MSTSRPLPLANLLRRFRLSAGLSQEALAERAGLSARAISDLERGLRIAPRPETVRMLTDALELTDEQHAELLQAARPDLWQRQEAGEEDTGRDAPVAPRPRMRALPIPPTQLIGRDDAVSRIRDLLLDENVRLITLTGQGGVGKTRMGIAVAESVVAEFPDGVVFADLSPLSNPAMVATAIGEALGITSAANRPMSETLALALEQRLMLLLVDNFEHLLSAAKVVADLLSDCRNLKILVTSRERLHLRGEHVVLIRALELPPTSSEWANAALLDIAAIPAVRLFLNRAQEVSFGFSLTEENAQVICEICRRLEGLPLAIELAASRVRLLGPAALLTRLDSRLSALTEGARDAPARQQTMRDTIGWSYDLLSGEEQAFFRRLAVFSGGIAPFAAASVAAAHDGIDVDPLFGIDLLVEKSLVGEIPGPLGQPRFAMLETIREFAQDRLAVAGEEHATRQAHAQWFLDLAVLAEGDLRYGNAQALWFARIDHELGNLRAAMGWYRAMGDGDRIIRIATALDEYWFAHSFYREYLYWLAAGRALRRALDPVVEGWSLCLESSAARLLGDIETSQRSITEALALAESTGDPFLWGRALLGSALLSGLANDYRQKLELCQRSLPYFESTGANNYLALMLVEIGRAHQSLGEIANAADSIDRGIALMRTTGDDWALGMTTWMRGDIAMVEQDFALAATMYRESIQLSWRTNDDCTVLFCMNGLVRLALQSEDVERAIRLMSTAVCHRDNWVDAPTNISTLFDDEVVIAEAALGVDDFQRTWEIGCALPFELGVTDALAFADEVMGKGSAAPKVAEQCH